MCQVNIWPFSLCLHQAPYKQLLGSVRTQAPPPMFPIPPSPSLPPTLTRGWRMGGERSATVLSPFTARFPPPPRLCEGRQLLCQTPREENQKKPRRGFTPRPARGGGWEGGVGVLRHLTKRERGLAGGRAGNGWRHYPPYQLRAPGLRARAWGGGHRTPPSWPSPTSPTSLKLATAPPPARGVRKVEGHVLARACDVKACSPVIGYQGYKVEGASSRLIHTVRLPR